MSTGADSFPRGLIGDFNVEASTTARTHPLHYICICTSTSKVCKIIAQSHHKQPKRPSFYILWGSRYICRFAHTSIAPLTSGMALPI